MSTSESSSYFLTPMLKGVIQQLTHLAFFGEGMSVVTGEKGSGKTALAKELPNHFEQAHDVVSVSLPKEQELVEFIESISSALGVRHDASLSVGELLSELRTFIQTLAAEKKLVVLVVDDAHNLDDQALGALVSVLQGLVSGHVGLHVILVSEPGLDERIDALQVLDVPVYDFELPAFSPTELSNFLARDPQYADTLNSSLVQKIWSGSKGVPGRALAMLGGGGEDPGEAGDTRFSIPFGHISAVAVLVLVLVWSIFFRGEDSTPVQQVRVTPTPVPTAEPLEEIEEVDESMLSSEETQSYDEVQYEELTADETLDEYVESSSEVDDYSGESAQLSNDASESVSMESGLSEVEPQEESVAEVQTSPTQEVRAPVGLPVNVKTLTDDEVFLLAQNPDFYTLQVVAASKKESLASYISRQANSGSLYLYRMHRRGKNWFVVVQGVYSSKEAAKSGLNALPKEQFKAGPWPRKIADVQSEIQEFREK